MSNKLKLTLSYLCVLLGYFFVFPFLVAILWNLFHKSSLSRLELSHVKYINRTLLLTVFGVLISLILSLIALGQLTLVVFWLWGLFRVANGFIRLVKQHEFYTS